MIQVILLGILLVLLGAFLVAPLRGLKGGVSASHPWSPHIHLGSINVGDSESFCVLIRDGSMPLSTAYSRVKATLTTDNPAEDWHGLDPVGRVSFLGNNGVSCDQDPNRLGIRIEFSVGNFGCPILNDPNVSCVHLFDRYYDTISGHEERRYADVYLKTSHVNGSAALYRHVINHETGHVLGLRDGDGTCPDSIMHSIYYGCSVNREWPSAGDRSSVQSLLPATGGGGGGK
jgi:hypothetical protein